LGKNRDKASSFKRMIWTSAGKGANNSPAWKDAESRICRPHDTFHRPSFPAKTGPGTVAFAVFVGPLG
jgi:hypothetical protein